MYDNHTGNVFLLIKERLKIVKKIKRLPLTISTLPIYNINRDNNTFSVYLYKLNAHLVHRWI